MKRNAIARIIIWSLVILVLLGTIVGVMTYRSYRSAVGTRHSFYSIPDTGSSSANGTKNDPATPVGLGSKAEVPADSVRDIQIEWASGNITIQPYDSADTITFYEEGCTDAKDAMVWKLKSDELKIQFWADHHDHSFSFGKSLSKDLTILVPRDWICEELELDTASTKLNAADLTIRKVDVDSASGVSQFDNCRVNSLDVDSASGDVYFTGELNSLDCDAASASVYAELSNVPSRIDMDSMSGSLELTLPDDAGFTINMDGLSNKFSSDFPTTVNNGRTVCGDGYCQIEMDGMSGRITIKKASSLASSASFPLSTVPAAPKAPTAPEAPTAPGFSTQGTTHHHTDACRTNPSSCPDYAATHHEEDHS